MVKIHIVLLSEQKRKRGTDITIGIHDHLESRSESRSNMAVCLALPARDIRLKLVALTAYRARNRAPHFVHRIMYFAQKSCTDTYSIECNQSGLICTSMQRTQLTLAVLVVVAEDSEVARHMK